MKAIRFAVIALGLLPAVTWAEDAVKATAAASGQQQQAIDKMQKMLDLLEAAGDVDAIRSKAVKLLVDQNETNALTPGLVKALAGKEPTEIVGRPARLLAEATHQQNDIAARLEDLLKRIAEARDLAERKGDTATVKTLDSAMEAGKGIPGTLKQVGNDLRNNKLGPAGQGQTTGTAGLTKMAGILNTIESTRLRVLSLELREMLDTLKQIKQVQTDVRDQTLNVGKPKE